MYSLVRRHAGTRRLGRYVDGACDAAEARRVEDHVAACSRCGRYLRFLLELRRASRELAHPKAPPELLDRVLARRAAGERVIVPAVSSPPPRGSRRALAVIAAFAGVLALVAALVLATRDAGAGVRMPGVLSAPAPAGALAERLTAYPRIVAASRAYSFLVRGLMRPRSLEWDRAGDIHDAAARATVSMGRDRAGPPAGLPGASQAASRP